MIFSSRILLRELPLGVREGEFTTVLPCGPTILAKLRAGDEALGTGGLRDYSSYRDLGVAEATNGLAHAHVIRMVAPYRPDLSPTIANCSKFLCRPSTKP